MAYFITMTNRLSGTAKYAQNAVFSAISGMGFQAMHLYKYTEPEETQAELKHRLDGIVSGLRRGDTVIFQYPSWNRRKYDLALARRIKSYGAKLIIFVHDIPALMFPDHEYETDDIIKILNTADTLIVASDALTKWLQEHGLNDEIPAIPQLLWDVPVDPWFRKDPLAQVQTRYQKIIHFPGDPDKFLFPHDWNNTAIPMHVYSETHARGDATCNYGYIDHPRLLRLLARGGFGLTWYGTDTVKEYFRYNCSFKTSTFLAAGIPVIVPSDSAAASILTKTGAGLCINDLTELAPLIESISQTQYTNLVTAVNRLSTLIQDGWFTRRAVTMAILSLFGLPPEKLTII